MAGKVREVHKLLVNEQLKRYQTPVTVVVESTKQEPNRCYVVAVLSDEGRFGVDNRQILQHLESRDLPVGIHLEGGQMEVYFGPPTPVEVLPDDIIQVRGVLRNARWSLIKAATRPALSIGIHTLRLVCTNGAYARQQLARDGLMAWATRQEVDAFLNRQLARVLSYQDTVLRRAVVSMSETIPEERDQQQILRLITRYIGEQKALELLVAAVSWYDHWNAVTAAAHQVNNPERHRKLQIEGGALLDRFLE